MQPTPEELCNLIENMLISSSIGNPTKANMYKTHGYVADSLLKPLDIIERISRYYGKNLKVCIKLSNKGYLWAWKAKNPSRRELINAIKTIQHGIPPSFAILSKAPQCYIRTNVTCLEYRDGSYEQHYFCPPEFLSLETIQKTFISYAQGCSWWKEGVLWKKGFAP